MRADVLVVGAGPAGIATAIAASLRGLRVAVVDSRRPPIDKSCGEGLLPEGVAALRRLGVNLHAKGAFPISGINFADEESSAIAAIPRGAAFAVRRTTLHQLLIERATEVGVAFHWGARISEFGLRGMRLGGNYFRFHWLVGADGQNSGVRKWAGLNPRPPHRFRFGFRRHFEITPWTDRVEVHWGNHSQIYVTPTGAAEVCIALLTSDPRDRVERALADFPRVAQNLRGARPVSAELGSTTFLGRARAVVCGRVALVGDASCTVDGIAGQGLSLAFQQALHLAEAFSRGDLHLYESAHRKVTKMATRITKLLLLMNESGWIRRKALRLFADQPDLFSKMISLHTGERTPEELKVREVFGLGWQVLRA
jgi:2-polyprenyl-6-methoxyphenol hydroxylase-like FAD-dependent oxidoreductase